MYDKPALLVPQSRTGEVKERVDHRGRVLRALDETALRETLRALAAHDIESMAVCLLFSFLHPQHEERVREIVREELPECSISLSCEIVPLIREYHRLSTTVINAYLQPILARYIDQLDRRLSAASIGPRQKYIMQSNGGMATFGAAGERGGGWEGGGGEMPTMRDCNLVMGDLSEDNFLGGQMRLDLVRARQAVKTKVADPLGFEPVAAAEGIVRVIEVKMEEAIKAISTMRGHDLRDFMLLAFGGAGPVHAGRIARDLGMAGLIVPLYPGVYSAIGLIMSDVKHDYVQSKMQPMSELSAEAVNRMFARLESLAAADLRSDGFAPEHIKIQRALDMRYAGQGYEITMPWTPSLPSPASGGGEGRADVGPPPPPP